MFEAGGAIASNFGNFFLGLTIDDVPYVGWSCYLREVFYCRGNNSPRSLVGFINVIGHISGEYLLLTVFLEEKWSSFFIEIILPSIFDVQRRIIQKLAIQMLYEPPSLCLFKV